MTVATNNNFHPEVAGVIQITRKRDKRPNLCVNLADITNTTCRMARLANEALGFDVTVPVQKIVALIEGREIKNNGTRRAFFILWKSDLEGLGVVFHAHSRNVTDDVTPINKATSHLTARELLGRVNAPSKSDNVNLTTFFNEIRARYPGKNIIVNALTETFEVVD